MLSKSSSPHGVKRVLTKRYVISELPGPEWPSTKGQVEPGTASLGEKKKKKKKKRETVLAIASSVTTFFDSNNSVYNRQLIVSYN